MESHTQLQKLRLTFYSSPDVSKLHLPPNLKKLVLEGTNEKAQFPPLRDYQVWSISRDPLSFLDIQTLKQIELRGYRTKSREVSAVKIKEEVEENEGNDRLNLIIKRRLARMMLLPMISDSEDDADRMDDDSYFS
ncbi:hypothetical protein RND71_042559 [Anisodus tanguticus]|uniref:Uncharacterized protein n=1 Tax=Anisodus tanguticus TaxID=243964 RepID=A0AAE1QTX9_9SOLA|nr:hypothetical protein RND71_042559 [Anisodus tanguticus]